MYMYSTCCTYVLQSVPGTAAVDLFSNDNFVLQTNYYSVLALFKQQPHASVFLDLFHLRGLVTVKSHVQSQIKFKWLP